MSTRSARLRFGLVTLMTVGLLAAYPLAANAATDTDKDGLPNTFERDKSKTSWTKKDTDKDGIADGKEDPDKDVLTNRYEYLSGTNPRKKDTDKDGLGDGREDADKDGLTNRQEQSLGTHPRKKDTDGDGYHDNTEHRAHTPDPKNPASHPVPPSNPGGAPIVSGAPACPVFPADNVWNVRIDGRDVAAESATMISTIGLTRGLHMDFGSYAGYGIPINVTSGDTPGSRVTFDYDDESDDVLYPIPASPKIEGGSDRHILMIDKDLCRLYELFAARKVDKLWRAGSATWDLRSNALRPAGWTSADAAGLPILPGLVRYDEVTAGEIAHALRFTTDRTRARYIYPARHEASDSDSASLPPMGLRVRLKASYDVSRFSPQARVIAVALQRYGMILADNGSPWYITGASNPGFDDDVMHQLDVITGRDLEVVDTAGLVNGP